MDNFDLRKYLAEGRLYKDDVWYIEASEDSADIEQAGPAYKKAVIDIIKSKHPDISDKDLEASIEVMNVTWYNEARSNAKGSDPEEMEVSAEDFADGAIEHYEDIIVFDNNNDLAEGRLYENDGNIKFINKFNPPQETIDYYDKNPFAKKPLSEFSKYKKNQIIQSLITHLSKGQVAYDLKLSKDDIFKYQNEDMVEIWADDYWKDSDFFTYGMYVDKDYFEFFNANKDLYPNNDLAEGKLLKEETTFNSIEDMSNFLVQGDYDELDGYVDKEFKIIKKHIKSDILDKGKKLTPSRLNSLIMRLEDKYDWY